jgi:hypothetical protein
MNSPLPRPVSLRILALTTVISLLMGCATMRYGGAPEPSFNLKTDIEELKQYGLSTSIKAYYDKKPNQTEQDRNYFVIGRLTLINLRYLEFVRNLTCDQQLLDSAVGMALLGLNLAGTAVPYAQTKTILAAISAGIAGSKDVIDKNYYFEKTIPALVAQMNAERQKALTPLLQGMQLSLKDYPFENAVVDVDNYYNAGTFTGAIQSIQADAGEKEQKQKVVNRRLTMPTLEEKAANIVLKAYFTKKYVEYHRNQVTEIDQLRKALETLDVAGIPTDKKIIDCLHELWQLRKKSDVEIVKALKEAGCQLK